MRTGLLDHVFNLHSTRMYYQDLLQRLRVLDTTVALHLPINALLANLTWTCVPAKWWNACRMPFILAHR